MKHLVVRRPSALLPVAMSSAALALMIFMRATWQSRAPAFRAVLAAGLAYGVIGLAFSAADRAASTSEVRFGWRLAAWIVSAAVFAVHIAHAHFHGRSRPAPAATALQASLGAALGAFVLAVAATVHAVWSGAGNLGALGLALVVWPAGTAVPAFLAALVAAAGLTLLRRWV